MSNQSSGTRGKGALPLTPPNHPQNFLRKPSGRGAHGWEQRKMRILRSTFLEKLHPSSRLIRVQAPTLSVTDRSLLQTASLSTNQCCRYRDPTKAVKAKQGETMNKLTLLLLTGVLFML